MASVSLREELNCSICLEVYTDPVMLTCGHNYCRLCIDHLLDTQETSGVYSCPECRMEFQRRPSLQRNTKLSNIMECFSCVRPVQAVASVSCTYCINSVVPAVKTCLQCETSLCEEHLAAHNRSVDHLLIETSTLDSSQKCSLHHDSFKYYCPVESTCICVSCYESETHRGHNVDLLTKAYEKKKQLKHDLQKLIAVREEDARKVQSLQDHWVKVQGKAAVVTEKVMALFVDLREKLGILEREVLTDITRQEEQASLQVSGLLQQLEDKKEVLSRTIGSLEEMCSITEVITVLQESELDISEFVSGDKILKGLHDLDEGLISATLHKGLSDITDGIKQGFYVPEVVDIFLDTNTAADFVFVSGDLKTASWSQVKHNRQNLPQRFKTFCQVLSSRTFSSGQHYWEVEMSRSEMCDVGASYPSVERHGEHSGIGDNEKSWSLRMYEGKFSALHNTVETSILPESSCQRIGIYLDYEAGRLSFYELCDPIRHLHTFTASFTEPLHVAFFLYDSWVKIRS